MDLNASPEPEDDEEVFDPQYCYENVDEYQEKHSDHVDPVVSAAEIARRVMRSIKDNITEEILLGEINETIQLPMYADRISKDGNKSRQGGSSIRERPQVVGAGWLAGLSDFKAY